jgi:pimeloyl-ACP methyl ester carboxylesterase
MMFKSLREPARRRSAATASATLLIVGLLAPAAAFAEPISAGKLSGTLTRPTGKAAATLLIIPGSGPTDRDGNNPLGVRSNSYKLFADALAARGVATVRIDKRGMFASKTAVADPNAVRFDDYVADTSAWTAAARKATGSRCVWLAGHSEGGLVALASASQPGICGLVLLATAGRPLATVLREQLRSNPANAPVLAQAEAAVSQLEAGRRVDVAAMHPALAKGLFNPTVQPYLIDLMRRDPISLIRQVRVPVLIIQGDNDLQVAVADATALHQARPSARLLIVPAMNHVLKRGPRDRAANLATYAQPDLPLAKGLAEAVASFVTMRR